MKTGEGLTRTRSSIFSATHFGREDRRIAKGKYFINFSPAVSDKAVKAIREEIRSWNLHLRSDKSIEDLSRMFNPMIRGWLQYYGRFYRSALYPPMRQLDRSLARWAYRKYKKLRGHLRRATHWVARISRRDPKLWAHWQMGVRIPGSSVAPPGILEIPGSLSPFVLHLPVAAAMAKSPFLLNRRDC